MGSSLIRVPKSSWEIFVMVSYMLTCITMHGISMGGLYANFVTSQTRPNLDDQLFVTTILWERITLAILP